MPPLDQHFAHFDRKKRRAMARMAQACLIDPRPWAVHTTVKPGMYDSQDPSAWTAMWGRLLFELPDEHLLGLWNQVAEVMSGGVQSTSESIEGDPFAIFLTGICQRHHEGTSLTAEGVEEHEGELWFKQTGVVKTGAMVDQVEGEKIIAFLKAEANVNTCERCGEKIHVWQVDNTRVSTFRATQAQGTPMSPQHSFMNIGEKPA